MPRVLERVLDVDLALRREPDLAVGDDRLAGGHALADDSLIVHLWDDGHGTEFDAIAGSDDINVLPFLSILHGLNGYDDGVGAVGDPHGHVHELAWPEGVGGVREGGLEGDGAGLRVDGVVDEGQFAAGDRRATVRRDGSDREAGRGVAHLRKLGLRDGDRYVHRLDLISG